ncbi:unnamed protein product [Spodoptera littoralis]|uniref:Uncharacterized protein n=1 Tax=Spodoptera littoralis TaxID=7109 RepID=A0A9P0MXF7_SPOLI|nr:unnamed protein product [Spodoptera littoralis]CAH1636943.1 unnamed protein product [Spodoptera littoralis]
MSKFIYLVLSLVVVSISCYKYVYAYQDVESTNSRRHSIMAKCAHKFGVTDNDLRTALRSGDVDVIDPCFWSCCFKGTGVLNKEGLYDLEATLPLIKLTFRDDDYKEVQEIAKLCETVNNEIVNNGDAGCERAAMLVSCFLDGGSNRHFY